MNKKYKYSWGTDFSFNFPMWPEQVYDETAKVCTAPNNSIIKSDADVRFTWGPAMVRYWPFDPKTEQFKCDKFPSTEMKIDYKNEVTIPPIDLQENYVDFTTPCIGPENRPIPYTKLFEELLPNDGSVDDFVKKITNYCPKVGGMPMVYGIEIYANMMNTTDIPQFGIMWPTVVETRSMDVVTGEYAVVRKYYTFEVLKYNKTVRTNVNDTPPLGFIDPVVVERDRKHLMIYRNWPSFVPKKELTDDSVKTVYIFRIGDAILQTLPMR